MDYSELVKSLRDSEEWATKDGSIPVGLIYRLSQAADAIEELEFACNRYEKDYKALCAYLPKWIPVTERLPEEYEDVLCYYEYFRYGDYNCMFRTIDRGYYGDGRWGGEAGQGHKNKVLYWMPLPSTEGLDEA